MFKSLDTITSGDRLLVGGKAYNCAQMKQAGFPVPEGLVVPADVRDDQLAQLPADPWFAHLPADTLFAVRSSGIAEDSEGDSFAGMYQTVLNVERRRLLEAVRECRRSAQSRQAEAYRASRHLAGDAATISVLVQRMVTAVTSGVAFTIHPVTGDDELVVNSVAGLGEALVSGLVTPEEARLPKTDRSELAQLLVRIEQFYGSPQDVEWCHDGRQYWVVQSRPITTRNPKSQIPNPKPEDANPNPQIPDPKVPEIEWTRANLAEVLPDQVSPQALGLYINLLNDGERAFFGQLMAPEAELGPIMKAFHGRLYFNLAQLRHVTDTVGAAFADTLRSFGHTEQIHPEDEIAKWPPIGQVLWALPDLARIFFNDIRMAHVFRAHEIRTNAALEKLTSVDPAALSDRDIWATIQWWIDIAPQSLPAVFVMSSVQRREDIVRKACRRVGYPYERLLYPILAAGERSVSSQQAFDLVTLANAARHEPGARAYLVENDGRFADFRAALAGTAFLEGLDQFLATYGHRGRYESDWAIPRMHENPAAVLFAIREQLKGEPQDPASLAERQAADAAEAWRAFEAHLPRWRRLTVLPSLRSTLRQLKQQYLWRERVRSDLTRVLSVLRAYHLTLANRFVERGWIDRRDDYFLLLLDEVKRACLEAETGRELRGIAARRAAEREAERPLDMPLFMRESELPALLHARPADGPVDDHELSGHCVSPGRVEADVVVLLDPSEFAAMKRGAILVTKATDPSWTPLFTLASGVIVEVGGMLSHASTIAREYGLPALANVKGATRILQTGQRVLLDASGGRVVRR